MTLDELIAQAQRVRAVIGSGDGVVALLDAPITAKRVPLVVQTPDPGNYALHEFHQRGEDDRWR